MDLYGLKEDSMEAAKVGVSVLAGAAVAKLVVDKAAAMLAPTVAEDKTSGKAENKDSALRKYVVPLIPVAVGVGIHSYGKNQFPMAAPGVAAGMVAVGLGRLISNIISKPTDATAMDVAALLPGGRDSALNGLGYVYDYNPFNGLGIGPGDVTAYMNGAPISIQGAPVSIQGLAGFGGSPTTISTAGSMSASLM